MSSWPSCNENTGSASGIRTTSEPATAATGWWATARAQRENMRSSTGLGFGRRNAGTRSENTCRPVSESSAGSRVIAAAIAVTTVTAEANPRRVINGIPATTNDPSAITTVPPANTTAVPDRASVRATDSATSMPSVSCARCRLTRNRA